MDRLRVRAYNVGFGDAFLVSFPEQTPGGGAEMRHILIDVGSVSGGSGAYGTVVANVLEELDGQPLDLYVMTHEHLDHVQGLLHAEKKTYTAQEDELCQKLGTRYAWLSASAEKSYYDNHPDAKKKHMAFLKDYKAIHRYLTALRSSPEAFPPEVEALWRNNALWMNPSPRKTDDCVGYLRDLAEAENTFYVHREFDPQGHHPFREATIEIWAPEENTADYYGTFKPMAMAMGLTPPPEGSRKRPSVTELLPPAGVDAGAFYNLIEARRGYVENLLAIDKAANETSIVLCLEWRGWRLLFPGDAEERSWMTMQREGVLKPVHFLKVGHHGSHNATPCAEILEEVFPQDRPDGRLRSAVVSYGMRTKDDGTLAGVYPGVPDPATIAIIEQRCDRLYDLYREKQPGEYIDIEFQDRAAHDSL